jgi:hypothetical protein
MELTRLAAKQKRCRDIERYALTDITDPQLRSRVTETLATYRRALAQCWHKQAISAEDSTQIDSIERDLETLSSQARLRTAY